VDNPFGIARRHGGNMLEFLRSWIINIVTISIILILFEIIIPSGKIKKIINLVSGFIILIAVINPFLTLKSQDFNLSGNTLADSYYIDKKEVENSNKVFKDTQMKQISEIYKTKLVGTIQEQISKLEGVSESNVEVDINEDYTSDKFGEINKVYIQLIKGKKKGENVEIKSVTTVKKVDISTKDTNKKNKTKSLKNADSETQRRTELVKQSLNKALEIQKDSIVVTVT
jgi:stage III sporulation protein AF